ncbi:hypothetical protein [Salinirubrum litoreum]|uniref:Lipoprotein n=1 Tax=Salinirubrum litoreum TaxID=1126234 RepID=A0ABD5RBQ3_9EURY|nr:hypothetical protein [Salinirubrum litoreum]
MKRRTFVGTTGVVLLAGCATQPTTETPTADPTPTSTERPTTTPDGTDTPTTEPTETPEPTDTPDDAAAALERAQTALVATVEAFLAVSDRDDPDFGTDVAGDATDFDPKPALEELTTAEAAIAEAERLATGEQTQTVETLRLTARFLGDTVALQPQHVRLYTRVREMERLFYREGGLSRTQDRVRALRNDVDDLEPAHERLRRQLRNLDSERMQRVRAVSYQQLERRVGLYEGEREAAAIVRERFRRMVTAQRAFEEGQNTYAGGNQFGRAESRFGSARTDFTSAAGYQSNFEAPPSFRPVLRRSTCYCETMAQAALQFREAATARQNGNDGEADRRRDRARRAVDDLSECNLRG